MAKENKIKLFYRFSNAGTSWLYYPFYNINTSTHTISGTVNEVQGEVYITDGNTSTLRLMAKEEPQVSQLAVVPTISTGNFTITGFESSDEIFVNAINGTLIKQVNLGGKTRSVNIESATAGTYLITVVRNGKKVKTFTVIKQ